MMQAIYDATRVSNKIHAANYSLLKKVTLATAKAYASETSGTASRLRKAVKLNALNGMRCGTTLRGDPGLDVLYTTFIFCPQSLLVSLGVSFGSLLAVGTGTKAGFLGVNSSRSKKALGVVVQYGLAGLPQFAAVAAAQHCEKKQKHAAANAAWLAASLFSVILEPVRVAMAVAVFTLAVPTALVCGVLFALIGVTRAALSSDPSPSSYAFLTDDIRRLAEALGSGFRLEDQVRSVEPLFNLLHQQSSASEAKRFLERHSNVQASILVSEIAGNIGKLGTPDLARRLFAGASTIEEVEKRYRRAALMVHPDRNLGGAEDNDHARVKAMSQALFAALSNACEVLRKESAITARRTSAAPVANKAPAPKVRPLQIVF